MNIFSLLKKNTDMSRLAKDIYKIYGKTIVKINVQLSMKYNPKFWGAHDIISRKKYVNISVRECT